MKHLPIAFKFLGIISAFAVFCIASTWFTTSKMRTIDEAYSDLCNHQMTANVAMARANRAVVSMRAAIADLLISRTATDNEAATTSLATYRANFSDLIDASGKAMPDYKVKFDDLKTSVSQTVDGSCAEAIRLGAATEESAVLRSQAVFLKECAPALTATTLKIKSVVDAMLKDTEAAVAATTDVTNSTIRTTWILLLGGLVLVLSCGVYAARLWISGPLTQLAMAMTSIADGQFSTVVDGGERKDEIGSIARVAEVFKATGIEKIRMEADAAEGRRVADEQRRQREEAEAASNQQRAAVVASLADSLAKLSQGNLAFRLEDRFAPEFEKLKADFNDTVANLQDAIKVVIENTGAIRVGTSEISTAADDLAKRTEQQAASLEETAAALDEITATVKKTSDGASHAHKMVSEAKSDAEHSGDVVNRAVSAMSEIEKSSRQIGQIIGVIDEIAFQTNLLALNAGVEAARAGEAGRGFAVVASEVRSLAQRSAEAAKEIKALIQASGTKVSDGVSLVGETGKALERIAAKVDEINIVVTEITASAREQATALGQVNIAINQMDRATQQNAAMVEESTAASHALRQQTEELDRLISNFQVDKHDGARRSTVPKPVRQANGDNATVVALKSIGRGGAVRNVEATSPAGGWEEF